MGLELGMRHCMSPSTSSSNPPVLPAPIMWGIGSLWPSAGRQRRSWGTALIKRRSMEAILKSGAAPFCVVGRNVDKYINASK